MNNIYDVVIIGSGIAGMSCALYLKRNNLNILLIENKVPGGQINYTSMIENYPGFDNIDGVSFNMNVLKQLKTIDVVPKFYDIIKINEKDGLKEIETTKELIKCKKIVISTGRKPKQLGLENEDKYMGKGISYCSFCDGNLYKDKEVIVIGGGSSALEESLFLSNICSKVTIINKNNQFKSDESLISKIKTKDNINIIYNSKTEKYIDENGKIGGILISSDNLTKEILASCIFVYIGYEPHVGLLDDLNIELENNYIITNNQGMTNIEGIYAAGDVVKKDFYQIVLAAADGVNVALNIIKKLQG